MQICMHMHDMLLSLLVMQWIDNLTIGIMNVNYKTNSTVFVVGQLNDCFNDIAAAISL